MTALVCTKRLQQSNLLKLDIDHILYRILPYHTATTLTPHHDIYAAIFVYRPRSGSSLFLWICADFSVAQHFRCSYDALEQLRLDRYGLINLNSKTQLYHILYFCKVFKPGSVLVSSGLANFIRSHSVVVWGLAKPNAEHTRL